MIICSIDIGFKNFAICIENINNNTLIYFDKIEISKSQKCYTMEKFYKILDTLKKYFIKVNYFLIESQVFKNLKVMYHLESYIYLKYIMNKNVKMIKIASETKNKYLNIFNKSKYRRKKLIVEKTYDIFNSDIEKYKLHLNILNDHIKKDDLCDAFCQLYVFQNYLLELY